MNEAEEVFDVVFPSGDESAEVVHPCEEAFYLPAPAIAAQFAAVLGIAFAPPPVRCNQLDAVFGFERFIEPVRVVCLVPDKPRGKFVEQASGKNLFHKLALGRRSALDRYGERKTVISGDSDDLGALAATRGTDGEAPFFALAKVASTNASSRFSLPCWCRCRASRFNASSSFPLRTHCWNRRWQVWNGGYFSGSSRHCAPLPNTQNTPFNTERVSCHGRPRLSARRAARSTGSTLSHCSSVNSHRPDIGACGAAQSTYRLHQFNTSHVYETGSRVFSPGI